MANITLDELAGMIQNQFTTIQVQFKQIDKRFDSVDKRFDRMEERQGHLENLIYQIIKDIDIIKTKLASLEDAVKYGKQDIVKK